MKYHKLVENAGRPKGFWGKLMINSMNKCHVGVTKWGLEHIDFQLNYNVLDVGCGGGKAVAEICEKIGNGKVYGVDYSELCVKKSKKLNKNNILCGKAAIMLASVSDLPFSDNSFDVVTAIETYYFWPDKIKNLKEIYRVLKKDGKILLVFEMLKTDDDPMKWNKVEKTLSIKSVTEDEIKKALADAGYSNVKTYTKKGTTWLCAAAQK